MLWASCSRAPGLYESRSEKPIYSTCLVSLSSKVGIFFDPRCRMFFEGRKRCETRAGSKKMRTWVRRLENEAKRGSKKLPTIKDNRASLKPYTCRNKTFLASYYLAFHTAP